MMRHSLGFYEPSRGRSGPGRYVEAILSGIDPEEFDVTIFGHRDGPYRDRPGFRFVASDSSSSNNFGAGISVQTIPHSRKIIRPRLIPQTFRLWAGMRRECLDLTRVFQEHPVTLLHTQNTGCEESPIAARMAKIPRVIGTFHVDSSYDLSHRRGGLAHRSLEFLSNRCLHRAIAVSQATAEDWIRRTRIRKSRVVRIVNGVDERSFSRNVEIDEARRRFNLPDDRQIYVGGVGRLEPAKGFATLIEAIALLRDEFPRLSVIIAGDGPLRPELEEKARSLDVAGRVHFLGFQKDVRRVYETLDVFCLPSLCEAMPYALLEAMAMKLPAIGSSVGGVPEAIDHGSTGFVIPPRDPRALASSLRILLADDGLRTRMGEAGRLRVIEHFHQADSVRRTIDVYREMLLELDPRGRSGRVGGIARDENARS